MDRQTTRRLSVEDAKAKLRSRSTPGTMQGMHAAGAAVAGARRNPWRAAGIAFAVGVTVGASSAARRMLFANIRRAIARGG